MKISSRSFRCFAGALVAITTASLSGTAHAAAALLQNVNLGVNQQTVYWEAATSNGEPINGGALSNANPTGTPTSGVGTIAPTAPGYRAGLGYYSFSGNYSFTASTSIQGGAFSDIQNVVFQRTSMPASSDITPEFLNEDLTFGGGPILTYTYLDGDTTMTAQLPATWMAVGGTLEAPNATIPGTFYNFTYQWDLSGVTQDITSVSINSQMMAHSSTLEARLDIGGNFVQVIPEPASAGLAALGLAGLLIRRRR